MAGTRNQVAFLKALTAAAACPHNFVSSSPVAPSTSIRFRHHQRALFRASGTALFHRAVFFCFFSVKEADLRCSLSPEHHMLLAGAYLADALQFGDER
jgi:hypothetical protein